MIKIVRTALGLLVYVTLMGTSSLMAQVVYPDDGILFDDTELPRIDLTITESNLQSLYADPESNNEYYAVFSFTHSDSAVGPLDVGLRFRGDTIRNKKKKSFRISFNSFDGGANLLGIEKMDLNAEVNDPALIRSKLAWELFRYLGVPGSRSNHVLLYINNTFYGVYLNTEHIDEKFVKSRFDNNDGNLFRNLWPADLVYLGASPEDYKFEVEGRRAYALRTNEKWDDYQDLTRLIATLDQYSGETLKMELEVLLNVQQYLKVMAVDVMCGNWDGYSGDKNNYFLYRDQVSGRFEYIPYNLENSFGIDFRDVDWASRSIYDWNLDLRPLYEKILDVEEYKEQFTMYVRQLAAYVTSTGLSDELVRWRDQISAYVAIDPYYSEDYGYTLTDFEEALDSTWGEHVDYGVQQFIATRVDAALTECIVADAPPLFSHVRVEPKPGRIQVDWTAEDDEPGFTTTLHYRIDGGDWVSEVKDAPAFTDPVSGHHSYRDTILPAGDSSEVEVYLTLSDVGGQENRFPDTSMSISYPLVHGPLYINEFAASNQSVIKDEFGEYDDWLEIFNASDEDVWLASYFLSDNMGSPGKYRLPELFLKPGGFYLIWLDDDEDQGSNHANFKISKDGEELRLSKMPSSGFQLVDSLDFGMQETDISLGRLVDGGTDWIAFPSPTPGYSNLSTGIADVQSPEQLLYIYPNPVSEGLIHFNKRVSGAIFNIMGQRMLEIQETEQASVSMLEPGVYIFRSKLGETVRFLVSR